MPLVFFVVDVLSCVQTEWRGLTVGKMKQGEREGLDDCEKYESVRAPSFHCYCVFHGEAMSRQRLYDQCEVGFANISDAVTTKVLEGAFIEFFKRF